MIPKSQRGPRPITLDAHVTDKDMRKIKGGGWTFEGIAQLYGPINDRGMRFLQGSGTKTIRERVDDGRVKVTDGHPMLAEASLTVGRILSAEDTATGVPYVAFLSATAEELADKISDGTIDENSIRLQPTNITPLHVPISEVPEHIREFTAIDKDGLAIVPGIREWRWVDLGLVSNSSQGVKAIFRPPTVVPFQGLAASSDSWAPEEAGARLEEWSQVPAFQAAAHLAQFYNEDGDVVLAGQIAAPDDEGQLVVSMSALPAALDELLAALKLSGLSVSAQHATFLAAYAHVRRYESDLTAPNRSASLSTTAATADCPQTSAGMGKQPPTDETSKAPVASSQKTAGQAPQAPTVGSKDASIELATLAHLDALARIREIERRLTEVPAHEPTGRRRGLSTAERAGSG